MSSDNGFDAEFKDLYDSLFRTVFRVAFRITGDSGQAEDLCHEAFIKYYKRHTPFPNTNQAKFWLIRVVKNIALNGEKRKNRERRAYQNLKGISSDAVGSGEDQFIERETEGNVKKALDLLPYKYRVVLVLKEFEELTYKEIGSIMGISEGNVKVRVHRGREKLEKIFKEFDGDVS